MNTQDLASRLTCIERDHLRITHIQPGRNARNFPPMGHAIKLHVLAKGRVPPKAIELGAEKVRER